MRPLRIAVDASREGDGAVRRIAQAAPVAHVDVAVDFETDRVAGGPVLGRADVVAGTLTGPQLLAARSLRWNHTWRAGPDRDLTPEMVRSPVVLTSSAGNGAIPLAEHALMLMLMLDRDAPRALRAQADRRWDRFGHGELAGTTVLVVGLGNVGRELARVAAALGMRVIGVRREAVHPVRHVQRVVPPDQMICVLPECDWVVVTAPLTASSRGLFGAREFAAMKPTARYVCLSRGELADEPALVHALTTGRIAGAGLDAHHVEPLPATSPLWAMDNVIITPHNGATSTATPERGVEIFLDNLRRFVAGRPLTNVVDKTRGY